MASENLSPEAARKIVEEKLPQQAHIILEQAGESANWNEIHDDLALLKWLQPTNPVEILEPVWDIFDACANAAANGNPRFRILKINSIKMKINSLVYELCNAESMNAESVYKCKNKAEKLTFFKNTKEKLEILTDDTEFSQYFINAHDAFKDFRGSIRVIFLQLEKNITRELQKTSNDLVDEQFHDQVIKPHKTRLRDLEDTKHLLPEFERSFFQPRNYSSSTSTGGYWTMEPGYTYVQKENQYMGEVNEEGKRHGYGKMTYSCDDIYEGYWQNDKLHGPGLYIWRDGGRFEGTFEEGQPVGVGKRIFASGNEYVGEFKEGKKSGKGTMEYNNKDFYNGEWDDDQMHGLGHYKWYTGDEYRGGFKNDKRHGKGTLILSNGEVYEATWEDGKMTNEPV